MLGHPVSLTTLKCHIFCMVLLFVAADTVPSVEFYFYDPYGTNGLVFVGDEGSLFCEAKDISDPVFTLTFNGGQIFDGKDVATEYADRIQVEEADSMPKLTKVKSSTCKSNVSVGMITKGTTTESDENLSSSSVAPDPKKPANLLVIVLIPILILVIMILLMLHLAFLIRRQFVNHASGGSSSNMVHSSTQTDLVPMSNSKADSRTSHSYDDVDNVPRVPYDGEFNAAEHRYPAASNLSSDKSYYSSTLYYES